MPTNFEAISRHSPYGGVISPNASVVMMTTPICTGLMSAFLVRSMISGMKMMIAGTASMKSPTIMNSNVSSSMIMKGSPPAAFAIHSDTTAGPRR